MSIPAIENPMAEINENTQSAWVALESLLSQSKAVELPSGQRSVSQPVPYTQLAHAKLLVASHIYDRAVDQLHKVDDRALHEYGQLAICKGPSTLASPSGSWTSTQRASALLSGACFVPSIPGLLFFAA